MVDSTANHARAHGEEVERRVGEWFTSLGYRLLARNASSRLGEIDLVLRGRGLVFVEVRFRRSARFGSPVATVDRRKQQRLCRAAAIWASRHGCWQDAMRIDVVGAMPLANACTTRSLDARPRRAADGSYLAAYRGLALCWLPGAIDG